MAEGGASVSGTVMPPSVYIDTSVLSYLTRRRSRERTVGRNQLITCLWWNAYGARFRRVVSARVLAEASRGCPDEIQKRLDALAPLQSVAPREETERLTHLVLRHTGLARSDEADAEHVALAATNGIDYLVTWNCRHLANPRIVPKVARACEQMGFHCPQICTPEAIIRRVVYGQADGVAA